SHPREEDAQLAFRGSDGTPPARVLGHRGRLLTCVGGRRRKGDATTGAPGARRERSVRRALQAPGAAQEVEGGRGELAVVTRADESLLGDVVVEDARARQVLLRVERVEHEDAAVAREATVVEEPELQIAHGHVRLEVSPEADGLSSERDSDHDSDRCRPLSRSIWTSNDAGARGVM